MGDSSDIDDLPDLVESSDEDSPVEKKVKTNAEIAKSWVNKSSKFLEKQELWMRIFCLCPFLFGINNIVPAAWVKALFTAKLLLNEKRQYEVTYLEWQEWECVDLLDHIIPIVQNKMRKEEVLCRCLDCVTVLEDCKKGVIIDVDLAIQAARKYEEVLDLWTTVLKDQICSGKETAAQFGVLYVIKLYHCHVISIEVHQKDFVEEKKKEYKNHASSRRAEEHKKQGNNFYSQGEYKQSIKFYTDALKEDPFHHVYFGNRAQAYNKVKEYKEALADGRRTVTLKPEYSKGHYRYGQAFYELGQLESAIKVNKKGLLLCEKVRSSDFMSVKELEEQGEKFLLARQERTQLQQPLTSIPKDLEKKLNSIPGSKDIDLNKKFGIDEPPLLVTSSSDSDSDSSPAPESRRRRKKSKSKVTKENKKASQKNNRSTKDMTENSSSTIEPPNFLAQSIEKAKQKIKEEQLELEAEKIELKARLQVEKAELRGLMAEGSEALMKNVNKAAIVNFKKALDITSNAVDLNDLGLDSADILTLKYAFGKAAVCTGIHKNILEGLEKFNEILEANARYPMAYYGLGKAYVTMNRFNLALKKLQQGYTIVEEIDRTFGLNQNREFWPGTKMVIEESDPKCLKKLLEDLIQLCHFPPSPDGVCRHHTDRTESRTNIYRSDPDFKGLYQIFCEMGCVVSFHPTCWKDYKNEHNTTIDKDILDTICVTPDCSGLIIKILVERDFTQKELISEKHVTKTKHSKDKKPVVKIKSTSDHKLAKKNDKKNLRKQRRRERFDEKEDLVEGAGKPPHLHIPDMMDFDHADVMGFEEDQNVPHPLPDEKEVMVLKKEDINTVQAPGKQKKNKKKKDKSKQLLSLEVNFTDRRDETLLGESSVFSDEEMKDAAEAKSVPVKSAVTTLQASQNAKKPVKTGEKISAVPDKEMAKVDNITQNLFSYFMDILKEHGPITIDDARIQQELEVFPVEAQEKIKSAGGLGDFLRQSLKFAVIDDVISLMTDAVKARDIALKRRDERVNQGRFPQTQNAWKTVGKGTDVDSLKESVTSDPPTLGKSSYVSVVQNKSFSSVAQTLKVASHTASSQDTGGLSKSNSSNSVSSTDSYIAQFKNFAEKFNFKPPESNINTIEQVQRKETYEDSEIDALDTIDDFPLKQESKSKLDDLDDFDIYSETTSQDCKNKKRHKKGKAKHEPKPLAEGIKAHAYISDSSSDISETSDISVDTKKQIVGGTPKPLKPLYRFVQEVTSEFKTETENDIIDICKPVNTLDDELKRLAEDYIRKTDEEFMSELADSVVDKIYSGKFVSDAEKAKTLKQVSSDIRKDFEKSARGGSLVGSGIWANTPASPDYSKNMGKFATDFMKRHYEKDNVLVSPTSDPSLLHSKKSFSPVDFNISDSNKRINSPVNKTSETVTDSSNGFPSSFISSSSTIVYTSGYNLFSGPSLGLDSFSSIKGPPPDFPRSPQPFVRPPVPPAMATSYYHTIPPPGPIGSQPHPSLPPLKMPSFHTVLKIDKETQVVNSLTTSVETMTEFQDWRELQEFLQRKDEFERQMRETTQYNDKLRADYQKLEQKLQEQQDKLTSQEEVFKVEKKKWLKERESLAAEVRYLKEQLYLKQQSEAELTKKITEEENKVTEIIKKSNEQRNKDMIEVKTVMEEAEQHRKNWKEQFERAKTAETEILKSKLTAATNKLERAQKEAAFHTQHLEGFAKKHEDDSKPVPAPLRQSLDHWKAVAQKCEATLAKVKHEYESQIADISSGKLMSELPPISVPSPSPIPDAIKAFMIPNNVQGKMPLPLPSMMSRNPGAFGPRPPPPTNITAGNLARFPAPNTVAPVRPEYSVSTATAVASSSPQPTTTVPPRPLQGAAGMVSRSLLGVRPPLAGPNRPPLRPPGVTQAGTQAPKTSFEKLILKLQMDFPNHERAEFNQFIQQLRQKKGGSLSGMSMQDIIAEVSEMIKESDLHNSSYKSSKTSNLIEKPVAPPPGLSTSWAFPVSSNTSNSSNGGGEMFHDDEDPCAICHEELTSGLIITLECSHKFHDECIRKWFKEQSTCPNCRVHSLLSDDFPSLG